MKDFELCEAYAGDKFLTVWNVHRVSDARVLVEQNDAAHNHANFLQRFRPVVRLQGSEVFKVLLRHDGVQSVCDFSHHLEKFESELKRMH